MADHRVKFKNVGPRRLTWESRLSELTQTAMRLAILKQGAVMSRSLSVKYTPGFRDRGDILVDLTRVVGTFEILKPEPAAEPKAVA